MNKHHLERLHAKTVLITGASYGIGEATARLMSRCGARLILTARTHDKLLALQEQLRHEGATVDIFAADLYDSVQIEALTHFLEQFEIDIFINNAGKSICRPIAESTDRTHDFTRTMSINYTAAVAITLTLLRKNRAVRMVNISSMSVLLPPTPYWAAYGASKTAIDHFARSAEGELGGRLSVGRIYFSLVATRMIEPTKAYANHSAMSVERAARIVARMAVSSRRSWRPIWANFAVVAAKLFRPIYCRNAMKLIDRAKR